jgi:L-proline dehydrogenase (EC 1.5.99.8)
VAESVADTMWILRRLLSFVAHLFHRIVVLLLPLVPRAIVGRVASRYIAGESLDDAVRVVRELNQRGFKGTIDVLGEDVTDLSQADAAADATSSSWSASTPSASTPACR